MHLTNYSVQKGGCEYGRHELGNCVSFSDLDAHLGDAVGFKRLVVHEMHGLIADTILAARDDLLGALHHAKATGASFGALVGIDLIVERGGRPLLIEVNPSPGMMPQNAWHAKYFRRLLDDYVAICTDHAAQPTDGSRPAVDGVHVPNYKGHGWIPLLRGSAAASPPLFDVALCGSTFVRVREDTQPCSE
jgi:hypothetical protein